MKYLFIALLIACGTIGHGTENNDVHKTYQEYLRYSVSYLGIRIGTIEVRNNGLIDDESPGIGRIEDTRITLRTFSGIPFLSVLTEFVSRTDGEGYFVESTTFDRQKGEWAYYQAVRDTGTHEIIVERGYSKEITADSVYNVEIDTIQSTYPVHDALTFLSLLRASVDGDTTMTVEVLIDRDIENIRIDMPVNVDTIKVRAFEDPIESYHVTGSIEFTAIHGLSRKYQTWVSRDGNRVPLLGRVHIAIGSVKIELETYTKSEMTPDY
jgi:hypothetical protein